MYNAYKMPPPSSLSSSKSKKTNSIHRMHDRMSIGTLHALKKILHSIMYLLPQAHFGRIAPTTSMLNAFYHTNGLLKTYSQFSSNEIVGNMNPMRWRICNIHCHWYMCVMLFIRQPTMSFHFSHTSIWINTHKPLVCVCLCGCFGGAKSHTIPSKKNCWTKKKKKNPQAHEICSPDLFFEYSKRFCVNDTHNAVAIELRERIRNGSFDSDGWCHN